MSGNLYKYVDIEYASEYSNSHMHDQWENRELIGIRQIYSIAELTSINTLQYSYIDIAVPMNCRKLSPFVGRLGSVYVSILITKHVDEWYVVSIMNSYLSTYYICDTFDGLLDLLILTKYGRSIVQESQCA